MTDTDPPMNLEELLDGINFPAGRIEIISYAEGRDASEEALEALRALPDESYRNLQHINAHLGLIERLPGSENIWS